MGDYVVFKFELEDFGEKWFEVVVGEDDEFKCICWMNMCSGF